MTDSEIVRQAFDVLLWKVEHPETSYPPNFDMDEVFDSVRRLEAQASRVGELERTQGGMEFTARLAVLEDVLTAARELLWAFEHTYEDPGPGSRIPTLRRAVEKAG